MSSRPNPPRSVCSRFIDLDPENSFIDLDPENNRGGEQ
jgi:hypothetical protein